MVKPIATGKFEIETGHDWPHWIKFLDAASAHRLRHNEIVEKIMAVPTVSGWWAQSIAVAYEQHIGRRLPGQSSDGTFSASVSRSIAGDAEAALARWIAVMDGQKAMAGRRPVAAPTTTTTRSGLNWRCKFDDGSRVVVNFLETKPGRTQAAVQHDRLAAAKEIGPVKDYWAEMAARLIARLQAPREKPAADTASRLDQ